MKNHAVFFVSLISLLSIYSSCYGQQNPGGAKAANEGKKIQEPSESEATSVSSKQQKSDEVVTDSTLTNSPFISCLQGPHFGRTTERSPRRLQVHYPASPAAGF